MRQKLDVYLDILHIYLSEVVAAFPASARKNLYGSRFGEQATNALKVLGKAIKALFAPSAKQHHHLIAKHWLYLIGTNNYHSVAFLKDAISETVYVSPFRFQKEGVQITQLNYPRRLWNLIVHLPLFFRLLSQNQYPVKRCWDAAFRATGLYESSLLLLQQYRPKSIVFSNDHTMEPRALLLAARQLGIPTFFIQHACVRPDFPPLRFDYNFLEGQDAEHKYRLSGSVDGEVFLIGVPRMDPYLQNKNTSKQVQRIGLCSNLLDRLEVIQTLLDFLHQNFPELQITYRPHPSDQRRLQHKDHILYSNSRQENPFEFLCKQDLVIAGNTSIHYEAAILNVVPIYYKFDQAGQTDDMYSFVKNGLVQAANSLEDLSTILRRNQGQKDQIEQKAQYYHAVLGTPEEGKSQTLVLDHIRHILQERQLLTPSQTKA